MIPEGLQMYFDVNSIRVGILFAKIKVDGRKFLIVDHENCL